MNNSTRPKDKQQQNNNTPNETQLHKQKTIKHHTKPNIHTLKHTKSKVTTTRSTQPKQTNKQANKQQQTPSIKQRPEKKTNTHNNTTRQ